MLKKWILAAVFFCVSGSVFAAEFGYITVITGEPKAKIFLNGQFTANEFIRRYPVEPGQHSVRIEYDGKLMYSELVVVKPNEAVVVSSEHFVDLRTTVANRGAIDRESRRLKEVKGNFGVGVSGALNYPASGPSVKWLMTDWLGFQVSGIGGIDIDGVTQSQAGIRTIIPIGQRVMWNAVLSGYIAPGYTRVQKKSVTKTDQNYSADVIGVAIGLEWAPFDPVYFSGEIGAGYEAKAAGSGTILMTAGVGVHVFF